VPEEGCVLQMTDDGALLVRPDGHIAWRSQSLEGSKTERAARAADSLRTALKTLHYMPCI